VHPIVGRAHAGIEGFCVNMFSENIVATYIFWHNT
jgi:hypothetical protein